MMGFLDIMMRFLDIYERFPGDIWYVSGRYLMDVLELFDGCLADS